MTADLKPVILSLLALAAVWGARSGAPSQTLVETLSAAPAAQTFTGIVTDSMCADADHSPMRMGPTDAECTVACVDAHDADYVLYDGTNVYVLSDKPAAQKFAAQKVKVTGTLDAATRTIRVDTIIAAL